jgi:hypothetical protein
MLCMSPPAVVMPPSQPVAMNRHPYGILPATFAANANLQAFFGPHLTQTVDANGTAFVSSIEGEGSVRAGVIFS